MPESFNVENDFIEKERWYETKPFLKCSLCHEIVKDLYALPSHAEDAILDRIENICHQKKTNFLDKLAIRGGANGIENYVTKDLPYKYLHSNGSEMTMTNKRSENEIKWQSHAMSEVCLEQIQTRDDEIGDYVRKWFKRHKKLSTPDFVENNPDGMSLWNEFLASSLSKELCESKRIAICTSANRKPYVFKSKENLEQQYETFLKERDEARYSRMVSAEGEQIMREKTDEDKIKYKEALDEASRLQGEQNILKGPESMLEL
eukprot:gene800-470_t